MLVALKVFGISKLIKFKNSMHITRGFSSSFVRLNFFSFHFIIDLSVHSQSQKSTSQNIIQ